jgi:hypothetical protein
MVSCSPACAQAVITNARDALMAVNLSSDCHRRRHCTFHSQITSTTPMLTQAACFQIPGYKAGSSYLIVSLHWRPTCIQGLLRDSWPLQFGDRVNAVRMASGEYHGWPPRLVRGAARQPAIASSLNHTVRSPRWRRPAS